jgi:transposase
VFVLPKERTRKVGNFLMTQEDYRQLEFAAYIGLDWADCKHVIRLRCAGGCEVEQSEVTHKPEALAEWVSGLRQRFGGQKIAVALEQSRGAVVHALMNYDFLVLFPVNPKTLAKYREAFRPSGAKDDPDDATLLQELVLLHRDKLRAWVPDDEQTRQLALLVEYRRTLIDDQTGLSNRLSSLLKLYYPQALGWAGELTTEQACAFLQRWPELTLVQAAGAEELRQFYAAHNCRRKELVTKRLTEIKLAQPLTTDQAVIKATAVMVQATARQLQVLIASIAQLQKQIEELFAKHPDYELFSSFPGAGPVIGPRLLTAMGADRNRYSAAREVQQFSGVAPVTERSGKSMWVHWRWACPKFVRQSFHEFARLSIQWSPWAKAFYERQRHLGKGHHTAIRTLAYRWIRIIYRCWKERVPYSEETYQQALGRRQSPLAKALVATSA